MQTRFSSCIGMEIVEESTEEVLGFVLDVLIHPDKGRVMGFYTGIHSYLSGFDIVNFGNRITVRDHHAICDPTEIIRLQPLLEDRRRLLGQRVRTEKGKWLGRCKDVQFDTESMHITWLFPKRFFRWGRSIPVREILEVRKDAIIVQEPGMAQVEIDEEKEALFTAPLSKPSV